MSLYLVRDPSTKKQAWLAWVDTANVRVYSWIPNLDRFVMNSDLGRDFYRENEMIYELVDEAGARAAIAAEVGKIDLRSRRWMLDEFAQSRFTRTADEVLAAATPTPRAGVRQQAVAIAGRVKEAAPGEWVTWKTYPAARRQLAYVAANDLRKGRVRALVAQAGTVDSRVLPAGDGSLLVQVSRIPTSQGGLRSVSLAKGRQQRGT